MMLKGIKQNPNKLNIFNSKNLEITQIFNAKRMNMSYTWIRRLSVINVPVLKFIYQSSTNSCIYDKYVRWYNPFRR